MSESRNWCCTACGKCVGTPEDLPWSCPCGGDRFTSMPPTENKVVPASQSSEGGEAEPVAAQPVLVTALGGPQGPPTSDALLRHVANPLPVGAPHEQHSAYARELDDLLRMSTEDGDE